MASRMFRTWVDAKRPITACQPIQDLILALKTAFPDGSAFGWHANESHYQADPPGDHTPYSADAWPLPNPKWVVFATDIMARDVGGVPGADKLFTYWLAEAKAGRVLWLKYLIWQGHIYDARHGWNVQLSKGHFDHIHVSVRTNHEHTALGSWNPIPNGGTPGTKPTS